MSRTIIYDSKGNDITCMKTFNALKYPCRECANKNCEEREDENMNKSIELFDKIRDYFMEARKLMPEITDDMLCDEGDGEKIYYMNGNDGTSFDWFCNNRLCEFLMFYKSTEMGFIKVFVNSDDTITGYMYKENYKHGDKPICLTKKL